MYTTINCESDCKCEKYRCFHKIRDIEMIETDLLHGCENSNQTDEEMNYMLDYSKFMTELSKTVPSVKKDAHVKVRDIIQKGPIPTTRDKNIDLLVRTTETFNDQPIFKVYIPYPEVEKTFMKHANEKYLRMNWFTNYHIYTIQKEKLFHEQVVQKYNINQMIDVMTDSLLSYIVNECYKFTRQKMKKNSCMWKVIDDRNMGEIYDTRTVITSLLKELFCNIRRDIIGLFNVESIVLEVYNYITSKE